MSVSRFTRYAWGVLALMLAVILWGAFVRASGSGAGCGADWPLCRGRVLLQNPGAATLIEFAHRATSGLAFLLTVGLFVWAWRLFPAGHRARRAAAASLALMVTESAIGAGLVLFEMVAHNRSAARVAWLSLHLTNTFLLVGALTLTAVWSWRPARERSSEPIGRELGLLALAIVATLALGITGAVAALSDTLFPAASLSEGVRQDFAATAHFLVRLRVLHPVVAVVVGIYLIGVAAWISARRSGAALPARILAGLVLAQWLVGAANVLLLTPVALQLLHLLVADLIWVTLVALVAVLIADRDGDADGAADVAADARAAIPGAARTGASALARLRVQRVARRGRAAQSAPSTASMHPRHVRPGEVHAGLPTQRPDRDWIWLTASVVLHAAIVITVLVILRREREAEEAASAPAAARQVDMVYLPPAPPTPRRAPAVRRAEPKPQPKPKPQPIPERMETRPPSTAPRAPEPLANAVRKLLAPPAPAPDAPTSPTTGGEEGKSHATTPSVLPERASRPAVAEAAPAPATTAAPGPGSMEAEAERIFGSHGKGTPLAGVSPRWSTEVGAEDASNCRPMPDPPAGTAGVEYGTAVGRILNRDSGLPVAGAHLQMLGTPYNAFTDARGWYEFRFDLALVRHCRTQIVWVSAPGFGRQTLTLVVGRNVTSDDVMLQRH
jgi:heme A synthase